MRKSAPGHNIFGKTLGKTTSQPHFDVIKENTLSNVNNRFDWLEGTWQCEEVNITPGHPLNLQVAQTGGVDHSNNFDSINTEIMAATYPHGGTTYLVAAAAIESCYKSNCKAVEAISKKLLRKDFEKRKLYLSEAYCLLWQNAGTGDIDGRTSSLYLKNGALACIIVDLCALGKIALRSDPERLKGGKSNHLIIEVSDATPTGTYLDEAVLNQVLALTKERPEKPFRSMMAWMDKFDSSDCVSITLKNLVTRGILGKEHSGFFGAFRKYPTLDPSPEEALVHDMKCITLKGEAPDSYMLSLLMLTRNADDSYMLEDPILEKHFSKEDYKKAKTNIKALLEKL